MTTTYTQFNYVSEHILENYVWSDLVFSSLRGAYFSKEYARLGRVSHEGIVIKNIRDEDRLVLALLGEAGTAADTELFSAELWEYIGD